MSHELMYTSVPQGLRAGSMGYCTVAVTRNCPPLLQEKLENLSGYRHLYSPFDDNAALNPVCFQHLRVSIGGKPYSILSRVADAGVDYSNRTNKYAHHLALQSSECPQANPAWVLAQPGLLSSHWSGQPHYIDAGRSAPRGGPPAGIAAAWKHATGDAGWAGVLAEAFLAKLTTPYYLLFDPGTDVLPLFAEAIALLPPEKQWQVTFSTYYAGLSTDATCIWRAVVRHSPEAKQALDKRLPVIDLTRSGERAEGGALVHLARTGERMAEERYEEKPLKLEKRPPTAKRVLDAEPYELTPMHKEPAKPRRRATEFDLVENEPERRTRAPWVFIGLSGLLTLVFGFVIVGAIWVFGGTGEKQASAKNGTDSGNEIATKPERNPVPPEPHDPQKPIEPVTTQPTKPEQNRPSSPEASGSPKPVGPKPPSTAPAGGQSNQPQVLPTSPKPEPGSTGTRPAPQTPKPPGAPGGSPAVNATGMAPPQPTIGVAGSGSKPPPANGNSIPALPSAKQARADVIPITYKYLPEKNEEEKEKHEFSISYPFNKAAFLESESTAGGTKMTWRVDAERPNRLLILGVGIGSPDPICSVEWQNGKLLLAPYQNGNLSDGMNFVRSIPLLLSHNGKPTTLVAFVSRQDAEKPDHKERLIAPINQDELPSFNTVQKEKTLRKPFPFKPGGLLYNSAVSLWSPKLRQELSFEAIDVAPDDLKLFKDKTLCSADCYTCRLVTSSFDPRLSRFETSVSLQYRYQELEGFRSTEGITDQKVLKEIHDHNAKVRKSNAEIREYVSANAPNFLSITNYNVIVRYKQLKLAIINP